MTPGLGSPWSCDLRFPVSHASGKIPPVCLIIISRITVTLQYTCLRVHCPLLHIILAHTLILIEKFARLSNRIFLASIPNLDSRFRFPIPAWQECHHHHGLRESAVMNPYWESWKQHTGTYTSLILRWGVRVQLAVLNEIDNQHTPKNKQVYNLRARQGFCDCQFGCVRTNWQVFYLSTGHVMGTVKFPLDGDFFKKRWKVKDEPIRLYSSVKRHLQAHFSCLTLPL